MDGRGNGWDRDNAGAFLDSWGILYGPGADDGLQAHEGIKMTLGQKQRMFTHLIGQLILWATENGFELTFGDAYRDPRVHGKVGEKGSYSASKSLHKMRLACDFNLFIEGEYQRTSEAYRPLGEYWEALHPLCEWGGSANRGDGNHFSFQHDGRW